MPVPFRGEDASAPYGIEAAPQAADAREEIDEPEGGGRPCRVVVSHLQTLQYLGRRLRLPCLEAVDGTQAAPEKGGYCVHADAGGLTEAGEFGHVLGVPGTICATMT